MGLSGRQAVPFVPFGPDFAKPLEAPRLIAQRPDGKMELALAHTSVAARITGNVARVEVRQLYQNPTSERLEAVYQFPLPANAAVTDMMFRIGRRVVVSEVKPRQEARQTYEAAKREGHTAALTEQERPNLFTQSVANIPPGQSVEVVLSYVHEIPFDQGRYQFVFPTTIGPRYTNASVKDAERVTPPVALPELRSAHDIEIAVELQPADAFAELAARSHVIVSGVDGKTGSRLVTLGEGERIPNKDFVLAWRPAKREPDARAVLGRDRDGDYLMLFVQPPAEVTERQVRPRQIVFLVDKSGSMMGQPIELCKQVIVKSLATMGPEDTFQIVAFDSGVSLMSEQPLAPTSENQAAAKAWLDALGGYGGTEMLAGIRTALDLPADPKRLKMVVFLTDGFIGNETQIIEHVGKAVEDGTRVFGFGIGSSVNRYLIDGVARAGRGAAEVVTLRDPVPEAVGRMFRRLDRPVLTDLEVRFEGLELADREPEKLPDLFAGQPLVVLGKVREKGGPARVALKGRLGLTPFERSFPVTVDEAGGRAVGELIGTLWARRRIETLSHRQPYSGPTDKEKEEIISLALRRKLITAYTSFVAVERTLKVDTQVPLTRLLVPNELPEGVDPAGIFGSATSVGVVPARVKPGDPEVRVEAAGAEAVLVTLPFGGAPLLAVPDESHGDWAARAAQRGHPRRHRRARAGGGGRTGRGARRRRGGGGGQAVARAFTAGRPARRQPARRAGAGLEGRDRREGRLGARALGRGGGGDAGGAARRVHRAPPRAARSDGGQPHLRAGRRRHRGQRGPARAGGARRGAAGGARRGGPLGAHAGAGRLAARAEAGVKRLRFIALVLGLLVAGVLFALGDDLRHVPLPTLRDGRIAPGPPPVHLRAQEVIGGWPTRVRVPARVTALLRDGATLWVGTFDAGVLRVLPDGSKLPVALAGRERMVNALAVHGGAIYAGTYGGLVRLSRDGRREAVLLRGLAVEALAEVDGELLAGTMRGLHRLTASGTAEVPVKRWRSEELRVTALARAGGRLYVGSSDGVWSVAWPLVSGSSQHHPLVFGAPAAKSNVVTALVAAGGGVVAGTDDAGLVLIGPAGVQALHTGDRLADQINPGALVAHGGRVLAGSAAGVLALDPARPDELGHARDTAVTALACDALGCVLGYDDGALVVRLPERV
jgi:Ca-activated chloride channel family protein